VSREKAVVSRLMCEHVVACGMWHVACGACGNERRSFCTCTKVTRILYEEGSACTKRGSSSQVPCFLPSCIAQLYCAPSRSQGAPCRLPSCMPCCMPCCLPCRLPCCLLCRMRFWFFALVLCFGSLLWFSEASCGPAWCRIGQHQAVQKVLHCVAFRCSRACRMRLLAVECCGRVLWPPLVLPCLLVPCFFLPCFWKRGGAATQAQQR